MKKVLSVLLVAAMILGLAACGGSTNSSNNTNNAKKGMTYEEYKAAAEEASVVVEGYVQQYAYSKAYGNVSMFIQDNDGAYYAYRAVCSEDQAKQLKEGVKVVVTGNKAAWAGEVEIGEGCTFEVVGTDTKVFDAKDVTASLGDAAALEAVMNQKVAIKGLTVEASADADGKAAAFLYNYDGSGAEGSNNDLYVNFSYNGAVYTFCVESDEVAEGTDTYKAVTELNVGDLVDVEGQMYWYNGPNLHISKITVVKASKADAAKGEGVMTYAEYAAAKNDTPVVIEAYVQGTAYNAQYGNVCLYLADADGAYYAYRAVCDDALAAKLTKGTKVKVSGTKAEWSGEVELAEGCTVEVLDGYYVLSYVDATAKLASEEELKALMNMPVAFNGLKVETIKDANGADVAFTYGWGGSGSAGSNSDLYFSASLDGKTYSFCVESDEVPEGSAAYTAVTELKVGDTVNLCGFLYWYNGPNAHINKVVVK